MPRRRCRGGGGILLYCPDPWLEACVYACARLLSMAMHAYARLHPNTPHACVRLGSGTQRWTSCIVMHRFSVEKKLVLVELLFKSIVCRKGAFRSKKNVHACARLDGEMAHTYTHLPPNTAHACAHLTLVCAHPSNHRCGLEVHPHLFTHSLTHDQTSRTRGTALEHP